MHDNANKISQFWQELKRRKVVRVITVYAAAAFVVLELTSIIVDPLKLPEWTLTFIIVLLCIGFIIAVILSWVYDLTPEGVRKTRSVSQPEQGKFAEKSPKVVGWKLATYASVVIIAGLLALHVINSRRSTNMRGLDKTVAVLPFENLGFESSGTSLHDAIPIALTMELRNIEGFKVPSWRSTFKYRETSMKMPEIGAELEVNYIILGSVQEQEGNVRIDIEFIHAESGEVIWSESEEMESNNIFRVQRAISAQVASALESNFDIERKNLTEDPDAYLAFLTGMKYYHTDETELTFLQAMESFKKAVQMDPDFIQAHVKLSTAHSWMYQLHYDHSPERLLMAKKAYDKASSIDPEHPDVRMSLGLYYYVLHDYEKALEQYEMINSRVVDEFELIICMAALYRRKNDLNKAKEYYLKAAEEDPQSRIPRLELGETCLMQRDYEEAEKYFDQYVLMGGTLEETLVNKIALHLLWKEGTTESRMALAEVKTSIGNESSPHLTHFSIQMDLMDSLYDQALLTLSQEGFEVLDEQFIYNTKNLYFARIYRLQNDMERAYLYYDSARVHLEEKISESPQDSRYHSALGIAYAGLGKKDEAIAAGEMAVNLMPLERDFYRGIFRLEDMARIYTMVGEYEKALEQIDQLLLMPSMISVNLLKKDPVWELLKNHHDFNIMLETYSDN